VSRDLTTPEGASLYSEWKSSIANEQPAGKRRRVRDSEMVDTRIGSGSDHTVFLNFLGRPTIGLTFDGPYGVYHSMYDNFYWMNKFGDPGYRYHAFMSVVWGVLALRLANADVLPFDFDFYADNIGQFVSELQKNNRLNLDEVRSRIAEFQQAGRQLKLAIEKALASESLTPAMAARLNRSIMQVESNWLNPEGIPGRPWFKHILYAARFTYAHLELPGLTEAVEKNDLKTAQAQARILADAIAKNAALLRQSCRDLERGAHPGAK
jgi:N-acetylated-alpha-linked acidic dipeptidase